MKSSKNIFRSLIILCSLWGLAGCNTPMPWNGAPFGKGLDAAFNQRPKPLAAGPWQAFNTKATKPGAVETAPPLPAPALFIPGPPTARRTTPQPVPTPAPFQLTAVSGEEPETLPLVVQAANTESQPIPPMAQSGNSYSSPVQNTPGQLVLAQNVAPQLQGSPPNGPPSPLRDLYEKAVRKHNSMDSYVVRFKRREVVGDQNRPEELMMLSFRKEPWSVYFKWVGPEAKGREVIYVKGRHDNMIHTLLAAGDVLLMPAGARFKVAPDSILVKAKTRYPITQAGFGSLIDRFGRLAAATDKGDPREGTGKHLGMLKRPEFEHQVNGVLQSIAPKSDPLLPRGGQRLWFFDPSSDLPMLVITQDDTGREVEYYCYDRLQFPVHLDDNDFDPEVLWKKK